MMLLSLAVAYNIETFSIDKCRNDEKWGDYRPKRVTSKSVMHWPSPSVQASPPADRRCRHPAREGSQG